MELTTSSSWAWHLGHSFKTVERDCRMALVQHNFGDVLFRPRSLCSSFYDAHFPPDLAKYTRMWCAPGGKDLHHFLVLLGIAVQVQNQVIQCRPGASNSSVVIRKHVP